MVRGSGPLLKPYVHQMLPPLLFCLDETHPAMVNTALSTIGELAMVSPEALHSSLESVLRRIITCLSDDNAGMQQQEVAWMF